MEPTISVPLLILEGMCECHTHLLFPDGQFDSNSSDLVFVRRYRGLEDRIKREGEEAGLKPVLKYWAGTWEMEEYFNQLIIEPGAKP